ncbi:MAG: DUF6266 family protein, partial [Bacteroidales bacterium]|nr:DUF6266 family protein [Bacteroidales bacterium]
MAIYIKGINGPFSGKVGNIIGSYRNNTDYIRAMPTKIANPRTPAQTEQRNKFAKAISLIKPLVPLIRQAKQQTKNKKA